MLRSVSIYSTLLVVGLVLAAVPGFAAKPRMDAFYPASLDPFTGNYVGRWDDVEQDEVNPDVAVQVYANGRDSYTVRITTKLDVRCPVWCETTVEAKGDTLEFAEGKYRGVIDGKTVKGDRSKGRATFTATRVELASPTLGKKAPDNAVVLYDGSNLDAWSGVEGWEIMEDGTLLVTPDGGYLSSKQKFKDVQLHAEFRLPYMARAKSQARGNSGVFVQEVFEIQVLDSFGLEGVFDECGALYKMAAPKVNACRPPLQWQTYDIDYRAPRFNADGSVETHATITVIQNGVTIHKNQEITYITGYKENERLAPLPTEPGSIKLQGHNNYVQFRNIWVVPQD